MVRTKAKPVHRDVSTPTKPLPVEDAAQPPQPPKKIRHKSPAGRTRGLLRKIRLEQKDPDLVTLKAPFVRQMRKIGKPLCSKNLHWRGLSTYIMREASETFIINLLKKAWILAQRGGRTRIVIKDLQTLAKILDIEAITNGMKQYDKIHPQEMTAAEKVEAAYDAETQPMEKIVEEAEDEDDVDYATPPEDSEATSGRSESSESSSDEEVA